MAKVVFRQEAINDLNEVWVYTFDECSEKQADKYYSALEFACTQIGKNPELGKKYDRISKNLLGLRTGKHIIFYQVISNDRIEVVRILHEGMDLKNRFDE
ncbi:type II toxin-antitoxin system RelE/ParE family toxin [Flavobacterium aurantiibacter]|uniref:Toxin n=1 Tax=Flavobacterium aurantiibacter TaxID=2023067 RepID=A0A255ZFA4_9FLAO|nr:type II toxin-antitoxin system RelE/ParE family toxin [Flavobacterium aurantiibacter]OYQ39565.1 plasmid stabilization protein [Flavobacterium aurantiibacter]